MMFREATDDEISLKLSQYGSRCEWLRDDKFLRDLEGDSVDTEILDEELRSLQDDDTQSCRGRTAKFLDSTTFQIVLCVLVLVDAVVVVSEILLDLHAIRGQYTDATEQLSRTVGFIKDNFGDDLGGYNGNNVDYILDVLSKKYGNQTEEEAEDENHRRRRNAGAPHLIDIGALLGDNSIVESEPAKPSLVDSAHFLWHKYLKHDTVKPRAKRRTKHKHSGERTQHQANLRAERVKRGSSSSDFDDPVGNSTHYDSHYSQKKSLSHTLLKLAHIMHYVSIAILGVFVIQVLLRLFSMGREFFKSKMEVFDAVIILASFALDVAFIEGITGAQGEQAAALLILFLLWRLLRVINGIMITAKKRQEFRIKLQKRARRRAEKRIELLEDDKQFKDKEIGSLKELSFTKGATTDEVNQCKPKRRSIFQKMDTSSGLSSIASLSLGLSMSMSGGSCAMINNMKQQSTPQQKTSRRTSLQDYLPGSNDKKPRKASLGPKRADRSPSPLFNRERMSSSMERVVEEVSSDDEPGPSSHSPSATVLMNHTSASHTDAVQLEDVVQNHVAVCRESPSPVRDSNSNSSVALHSPVLGNSTQCAVDDAAPRQVTFVLTKDSSSSSSLVSTEGRDHMTAETCTDSANLIQSLSSSLTSISSTSLQSPSIVDPVITIETPNGSVASSKIEPIPDNNNIRLPLEQQPPTQSGRWQRSQSYELRPSSPDADKQQAQRRRSAEADLFLKQVQDGHVTHL